MNTGDRLQDPERPLVSVLFVSFERPDLLQRTLSSFLQHTKYPALELVVADDGSSVAVQERIRQLPFDRFVMSERNRGLGANLNAGLAACRGEYVLVLQDDWECVGPEDYLERAVEAMAAHPTIAFIRFYDLLRYGSAGSGLKLIDNRHADKAYSDTPHLRRASSIVSLGPYLERCGMSDGEIDYASRFAAQSQWHCGFLAEHVPGVFVHIGEEHSHRLHTFRARMEARLHPLAMTAKRLFPGLYQRTRDAYRRGVRAYDALRFR